MTKASPHAAKRLLERQITEYDINNVLNNGEELYEDLEAGKYGSRLDIGDKYLVVIWIYNGEDKEVVTAYWRNKKLSKYKFIE